MTSQHKELLLLNHNFTLPHISPNIISLLFKIQKLHKDHINCFTKLSDTKFASGSLDGSISICIINCSTKTYIQIINKEHAHKDSINYICNLPNNHIASCSKDSTIKIWDYSSNKILSIITVLTEHTNRVLQLISITHNRLASIAYDKTIKIWNCHTYLKLQTPYEHLEGFPRSLMQLKGKEIICLSISYRNCCGNLLFYNLDKPFNKVGIVNDVYTCNQNGMFELSNGIIAVTVLEPICGVVIVDSVNYTKVQMIEIYNNNNLNKWYGGICVLNEYNFIYYMKGLLCPIHINNNNRYQIVYQTDNQCKDINGCGVILLDNNRYIIASNSNNK